ncbi:hypothetical protein [Denitrobaculum tricleocarpae]|uniref:Uncharacterized protein n=1 Tax=Denitrobaculum tricleocarpae TaxID=2591009 RepID=A0A545TY78_9PROT|nr:hypothetical protein [Denitrobaculum tricleocarpae]TQV82176.1 hypothetical protein FKG95_08115 [Denitrobaculum tricleocarpae]
MEKDIGFDPVADAVAVLSELELIYFIPVFILFAIMFLTGTFKRRLPRRYRWQAGKGFVPLDVKARFESLTADQKEKLGKQFDDQNI